MSLIRNLTKTFRDPAHRPSLTFRAGTLRACSVTLAMPIRDHPKFVFLLGQRVCSLRVWPARKAPAPHTENPDAEWILA